MGKSICMDYFGVHNWLKPPKNARNRQSPFISIALLPNSFYVYYQKKFIFAHQYFQASYMKYSIRLLSAVPILLAFNSFGQTDTTFIDKDWKPTDKANATYFRTSKKLADNSYKVCDYYTDGNIQMTGYYLRLVPIEIDSPHNPAKNGIFTFYDDHSTTKTSEGNILHGVYEGQWKDFFTNTTQIKSEYFFDKNIMDGKTCVFDSITGEKSISGEYRKGTRAGKWTTYYLPSKKVRTETIYRNGRGNCKVYYENGNLQGEGIYSTNATQEGEWKYYDSTGLPTSIYNFRNDTMDGPYTVYVTLSTDTVSTGNELIVKGNTKGFVACVKEKGLMKAGKVNDTIRFFNPVTGQVNRLMQFYNGEPNGIYVDYDNGLIIGTGFFKNGEKSGKNKRYFANTKQLFKEENYLDGKRDGMALEYYPNGQQKYEVQFANGHENGKRKTFFSNGMLQSTKTYHLDTLTGPAVYYDSTNGSISREGYYISGKQNGQWQYYNYEKMLRGSINFENDQKEGPAIFYDILTGQVTQKGNNKHGVANGEWLAYYRNSMKLKAIMHFEEDSLNGETIYFDAEGGILLRNNFINNKKEGISLCYYNGENKAKVLVSMYYKNDVQEGPCEVYYASGKRMSLQRYAKGKRKACEYYSESGLPMESADDTVQSALINRSEELKKFFAEHSYHE